MAKDFKDNNNKYPFKEEPKLGMQGSSAPIFVVGWVVGAMILVQAVKFGPKSFFGQVDTSTKQIDSVALNKIQQIHEKVFQSTSDVSDTILKQKLKQFAQDTMKGK